MKIAKQLWLFFKLLSTVFMLTLCILYVGAFVRFWALFKELDSMKNLTAMALINLHNSNPAENGNYPPMEKNALDLSAEIHRQNFSANIAFLEIPSRVLCTKSAAMQNGTLKPTVFVIIKSRSSETFQRAAIRTTFGAHFEQKLIFAIGKSNVPEDEDALILESQIHGDILKADFADTYYNLSYKSLAILRWITLHCPYENFYIQADSDALLFPENLHLFAEKYSSIKRHIYGLCWQNAPISRDGKWGVPESRYIFKRYPDYCSGAAFVMTGDVPMLLYSYVKNSSRYMSVDDAYFSGIVAERAGISRQRVPGVSFREDVKLGQDLCPCRKYLAIFEYKSSSELTEAWTKFRKIQGECL